MTQGRLLSINWCSKTYQDKEKTEGSNVHVKKLISLKKSKLTAERLKFNFVTFKVYGNSLPWKRETCTCTENHVHVFSGVTSAPAFWGNWCSEVFPWTSRSKSRTNSWKEAASLILQSIRALSFKNLATLGNTRSVFLQLFSLSLQRNWKTVRSVCLAWLL